MVTSILNDTSSFNKSPSPAFESKQVAKSQSVLPDEVLNALEAVQGLNLKIEICGSWLWIFGADGMHETILRAANFNWSSKRGCWYFCPAKDKPQTDKPQPSRQPWDMGKIRQKYGSQVVQL